MIDVRVTDGHNVAVPGADVSIVRGLNEALAHGTTDDAGRRRLSVPRSTDAVQVVVRKIGFARADQFVVPSHDSLAVRITLHRAPQALPTVTVTAQEDLERKRYHIDADEIAASKRPILDALDIVTKLRPDMIYPPQGNGGADPCGLFYIWVNGKRVVYPPIDAGLAMRASQGRRAARATPHLGAAGLSRVPVSVQSVLSTIHPEHIEELNYTSCDDFSVDGNFTRNAVFVSLKPGVAFEPGRGSFVADTSSYIVGATTAAAFATPSVPPPAEAPAARAPQPLARYRGRLLGVYDGLSGDPLAGAEVLDVATGTYASTTNTGTVSLVFLPEGTSAIKIRKPGFAELTMDVTISARDTVPVTVILAKP
ncbi:MAG: carboxypeptidase-like regulatory domain-containing protein [Gemmatimonadaceae bacterium]